MAYHYNPDTGNAGLCKAEDKTNCPFYAGVTESRHYATEGDARKGFERENEKVFKGLLTGESKSSFNVKEYGKQFLGENEDLSTVNSKGFYPKAKERKKRLGL